MPNIIRVGITIDFFSIVEYSTYIPITRCSMTGTRMKIILTASSTEGIHDLITLLETVVEDIKGGAEQNVFEENDDGKITQVTYIIKPE